MQSEKEKEKNDKIKKHTLWNNFKKANIWVTGVPGKKEADWGRRRKY